MIFTDRTITVRKGESKINEPIIVYRGDYELEIRFTISNSKFKFKNGTNLIESEKASHGQLVILTPYGGNIFSDIVKCNEGTVSFLLTKEMLDQIEELGLYSFQIRLFDYYRESRITIPPIEYGIEIREPITSEDHDNTVNNAIVGYSIAKVVNPKEENVGPTFDDNGQYNKTDWETGDRISEGKLNKMEDALYKINQNEVNDRTTLNKQMTANFGALRAEINNLVLESGESNMEVVQARGEEATLNDRLSKIEQVTQKKIYQFDCVDTMKQYDLKVGEVCETLGYYRPNDGGRSKYLIKENLIADGAYVVEISNGLFAELVIENNTVNFKQLGAKSQEDDSNRHDNARYLELYAGKLKAGVSHKLYISRGVYYFSPCVIVGELGLNIDGDYDFSNGYTRGTVLKPFTNNQECIWQLGSSDEYLTNFSINNVSFSTAETIIKNDGITLNSGNLANVGVALKLINAQFGKIGDIHFTGIKGQAMNVCSSWEIDFNKLFFRAVNSRDNGVLVFDTVDKTLTEWANVTCCNFRYLNFESIMGDCIRFKKTCKLSNSSFGVINVEDNKWSCGSDGSTWVTFNSEGDSFDELNDIHTYILKFDDSANLRGVNFKTIEMNNVCSWYNEYNGKKYALDSVIKFGNYGDVAISINDINVLGFNKDLRIIHLLEGDVSWYANSVTINNIYSNSTDYKMYFDVKGLSNLKVDNIYNRKGYATNNIGCDMIPFSEIYHGYSDCGRGSLYYDSDSINKLKLVVKPVTHLTDSGSQRNRTIGSLYVKPNAKLMFRAKAAAGTNVNVRFDGWGSEKSVTFTGDNEWHWYTLDLQDIFDIPTLVNIKTHYDSKYNNIEYYLDCFKIV